MDGILNICKPVGMSSFKCLSIVKRKLGLAKVGHLGTLDPLACGVLVLLCGKATKLKDEPKRQITKPPLQSDEK